MQRVGFLALGRVLSHGVALGSLSGPLCGCCGLLLGLSLRRPLSETLTVGPPYVGVCSLLIGTSNGRWEEEDALSAGQRFSVQCRKDFIYSFFFTVMPLPIGVTVGSVYVIC